MAKLFGFSIEDSEPLSPTAVSPVPPNNEDGSDHYMSSGFFGSYVDIEGIYKTEYDLIKRYRELALQPEADSAIEDIVNEAIVSDTNDTPVQINLDNLNASDGIKDKVRKEFKHITDLFITPHPYVFGSGVPLFSGKNIPEVGLDFQRLLEVNKSRGIFQYQYKVKNIVD